MADLSAKDVEKAEFAFSIYDADGSNVVDAVDLGNVLRALNLNPTNATIEKLGGTKKKGEKLLKLDEFLPIYSQCKKDKEQGCYEDFIECLKLYDKEENGTMMAGELSHILLSLGEKLTDAEVETVLKECMDPEDEDGFIPYARKYRFIYIEKAHASREIDKESKSVSKAASVRNNINVEHR